jgi:O-antigen/teichoic acid export membrane protein
MTGHTSLKLANSLVTSALSVGLSILLIPPWGLMGAAVASLASTAIINTLGVVEVFILYRMLPFNLSFLKPILAGLAGATVAWGADRLLPMESELLRAIGASVVLAATFVGMLLMLGLSQEDRVVLHRVAQRVIPTSLRRRPAAQESEEVEQDPFASCE